MNKNCFTLAEILITLTIIGIVASMTIPSLLQKTQEQELRSAWKKTYSDLEQAMKRMMIENGETILDICSDSDSEQNADCMTKELSKYIINTKVCTSTQNYKKCWPHKWYQLNGTSEGTINIGLIMNNGTLLQVYRQNAYNGGIIIDVNGIKGPNTVSKDIFRVWVLKNGLKPAGYKDDWCSESLPSTCDPASTGWGCSAKYLYE